MVELREESQPRARGAGGFVSYRCGLYCSSDIDTVTDFPTGMEQLQLEKGLVHFVPTTREPRSDLGRQVTSSCSERMYSNK